MDTEILVTKIQRFSTHDGPGIRTVVFLSGCPLRCWWCHNPEAQLSRASVQFVPTMCIGCGACAEVCLHNAHRTEEKGHYLDRTRCTGCMKCTEVCPSGALTPSAKEMSLNEILSIVERDRTFYGDTGEVQTGGMTLSGGEPLMIPEHALALLRAAKEMGIHTAVETSGCFDGAILPELVPLTDVFLWDCKDGDRERHRKNIGVSDEGILHNLNCAGALGARILLRCIVIEGVNADTATADAIAYAYRLGGCESAELLPYHPYGESKYAQLGLHGRADAAYVPSEATLAWMREALLQRGVTLKAD